MIAPRKTIANLYLYDPLDRLTGAHSTQRFYNGTRMATEIQRDRKTCFFEYEATPLAELQLGDAATLLATDLQTSVLRGVSPAISQPQSYDPYGHRPTTNGLLSLLGFNGERPDAITGHYLLGQGYRAYNPLLMRFNSPDNLSPFDEGGINSYTYCSNDPINKIDPSGHSWKWLLKLLRRRSAHVSVAVPKTPTKTILSSSPKLYPAAEATSEQWNKINTNFKKWGKAREQQYEFSRGGHPPSISPPTKEQWKDIRRSVANLANQESGIAHTASHPSLSKEPAKVKFNPITTINAFKSPEYIKTGKQGRLFTTDDIAITANEFRQRK